MYNEPWRRYHTINHIEACLRYFDACSQYAQNPDIVELAIWFHDCIYKIGDPENEVNSRDWFLEISRGQIDDSVRDTIAELIMDTSHRGPPATNDGKLLADIDMTSFSLPWEEYIEDSAAVRDEFNKPYSFETRAKMIGFLNSLLDNHTLYYTPHYLEHHENQAQENIRKYLDQISEQ
jgi:predicted metal-dependent HD superfamily phosphohydrolase